MTLTITLLAAALSLASLALLWRLAATVAAVREELANYHTVTWALLDELLGEWDAGEVAELVKKGLLHRHGLDLQKLHKELGDVCWYIAALCTECGFDLGDVLNANIAKLQTRYPNGYRAADSIARIDTTIHSTESASK